jgi:hypothetical protein
VKKTSPPINAPALLIGLIALVALGSVATASAGTIIVSPERASVVRDRNEEDGESVARLILSLTDTAKRFHGQANALPAPCSTERVAPQHSTIAQSPPPRCVPNEQTLVSVRLIDMPPPVL